MNVLFILGHPRTDSLCGALADAYGEGARAAGTEVRRLDLATLDFDPNVHTISPNQQAFEDDIRKAHGLILWAEHLVFVYPTWWGTMPVLLKGFLDRTLTPDFAFKICEGGTGYQGLLDGRSAQLITTMDTPPLIHRLVYRQPGRNAMARATLGFCGIRPVRSLVCGSVKDASLQQRQQWLILCGYVFLGGAWNDALPWLLSLPLLLAIMPSITLSGIPDTEADAAAGKRTLAVRLGQRGALMLALIFTLLAAGVALIGQLMNLAGGAFAGIAYVVIPHAAMLVWLLLHAHRIGQAAWPHRWAHGGITDLCPVVRAVPTVQVGWMSGRLSRIAVFPRNALADTASDAGHQARTGKGSASGVPAGPPAAGALYVSIRQRTSLGGSYVR